ncbi:helix-turn-helix domain-containing protein [Streptomyces arboris]|uniref:helix-turn-helix domain-containing protein n=1 Tax=Streptomyces arboris TaxID=2600619 RepID=UPI003C2C9CFB
MNTVAPKDSTVTVPEVMSALRLSRSKVYDLLRSGEIRSFTIGRSRRIPAGELATYMQSRLEECA